MKKQRVVQLDLIRILACLMVIMMHSPMPIKDGEGGLMATLLYVGTSYFCAPCIGLFFMVSGALLLPTRETALPFIRKRLAKVVGPTLVASFFYLAVHHFLGSGGSWVTELLSLPFSAQGTGILWFMYTLIGLYLLAPVISGWISTPPNLQELRIYSTLWLVTLCYPVISLFAQTNETNTGMLYYFSGYAGYFVMGYILYRYPSFLRWRYLAPAFLLSCVAPVACKAMSWNVDFYRMFWYTSVFVVVMCMALFKALMQWGACLKWSEQSKRLIARLSDLSFGVYLVHFFLMRDWLWKCDFISQISNLYLQTFVIALLTTVASFAICAVISYLPLSEYIIGYHRKRTAS